MVTGACMLPPPRPAPWIASLLAVAALGFGCSKKVEEPDPVKSDVVRGTAKSASVAPVKPAPSPRASKKLESVDMKVGTGAEAKTGDTVTVHYTGTLTNGTKFDSSLDRGDPFTFTIGAGNVIKGWDDGVVGMKVGGKRKLTIPPALGYGAAGSPPKIPPNATLVFEIELLGVK